MASTHVFLTIGLSEVPILVAAYRLCRVYLERDGGLPSFSALCIGDTIDEAERVRRLLMSRLTAESLLPPGDTLRWTAYVVPHSKPDAIRTAVSNLLRLQPPGRHFHLHYTGGSRALSVHAMEAILSSVDARGEPYMYEASYLSSGEDRLTWGSTAPVDFGDERMSWSLGIPELAGLNDFTPNFYSLSCRRRFGLSEPDPSVMAAGCAIVPLLLIPENRHKYANWLRTCWDALWQRDSGGRDWARWPQPPPRGSWPEKEIPWVVLAPEDTWNEITVNLAACFGGSAVWMPAQEGWILRIRNLQEEQLSRFNQFLHYQCLELLAYSSLKTTLRELGYADWSVQCSMHFARQNARGSSLRDFELDVVAVLGFQLLAISCSLSADQPTLKRKAFEVLHRAKQVGGSGARAILISTLSPTEADVLMRDVEEDTGPREKNLEIWGVNHVGDLAGRFRDYLQRKLLLSPRPLTQ